MTYFMDQPRTQKLQTVCFNSDKVISIIKMHGSREDAKRGSALNEWLNE